MSGCSCQPDPDRDVQCVDVCGHYITEASDCRTFHVQSDKGDLSLFGCISDDRGTVLCDTGPAAVYRTTIQSMQNGWAPFAACMIELVMRISATVGLVGMLGYTSVCIASPMAWFGACALLIPCYYRMMKVWKKDK